MLLLPTMLQWTSCWKTFCDSNIQFSLWLSRSFTEEEKGSTRPGCLLVFPRPVCPGGARRGSQQSGSQAPLLITVLCGLCSKWQKWDCSSKSRYGFKFYSSWQTALQRDCTNLWSAKHECPFPHILNFFILDNTIEEKMPSGCFNLYFFKYEWAFPINVLVIYIYLSTSCLFRV